MELRGHALVTGASYGIGEEFARQLAARGMSLVLVARSQDRLIALRDNLLNQHPGIDVRCMALDLSVPGAPAELFARTQAASIEVNLLVNNAGFGAFGEFSITDRARLRQMIDLNIAALVELSHLYLQPMVQRGAGVILNVASIAGLISLPYNAVYAATKAFVVSFSHALYDEARPHGVLVMVVNPGRTETKFFETAGMDPDDSPTQRQTAEQVVTEALRAMDKGRRSTTTGALNRLLLRFAALVPRGWISAAVARRTRRSKL